MSVVILDAALGYVDRCRPWPIIPLGPNKRPTIRTGAGHAEHATIELDVIRDWHRRGLLVAIGTPTGAPSGTVVIDVDAKHDGERLLAALERPDVLGPLPRTHVVRTRSGGLHVYCAHPGVDVRSGATRGQLAKLLEGRPGIDVRADRALVVLPPSAGYTWIADDDGGPLPPLPARWLATINGAGDPPIVTSTLPEITISDDRRVRRAGAYLAKMAPSVSGSGGHDALWNAVAAMVVGFDLDTSTARALITRDFNPRCSPPWNERAIEHKLADVAARCTRERGYLLGGSR